MKILCPTCSTAINIDGITRYACIQCSHCGRKFKGFEATVSRGDFFRNIFNPFVDSYFEFGQWETTHCYHCHEDLVMEVLPNGSYSPPKRCPSCTGRLNCKKATPESKVNYVLPPGRTPPVEQKAEPTPEVKPTPVVKVERVLKDPVTATVDALKVLPVKNWAISIAGMDFTPDQIKALDKAVKIPKSVLRKLYNWNIITFNGVGERSDKANFDVDDPFGVLEPYTEEEELIAFAKCS